MSNDANSSETILKFQDNASNKCWQESLQMLIQLMTAQSQLMTAQNQLLTQLVQQNDVLISELLANTADDPVSTGGVFD